MFISKKTHDRILTEAIAKERNDCATDRAGDQRALETERFISDSLRTEIAGMQALYDLGVREQAQRDKDTANKKAKREAAKSAAANVPATAQRKAG